MSYQEDGTVYADIGRELRVVRDRDGSPTRWDCYGNTPGEAVRREVERKIDVLRRDIERLEFLRDGLPRSTESTK